MTYTDADINYLYILKMTYNLGHQCTLSCQKMCAVCRITQTKILRNIWGVGVFELRVGLTIQGGVNFSRVGLYPSSEL